MSLPKLKPATGSMPDAGIIAQVIGGDRDAFALLMRRYNRTLFRTARSIIKDDRDAEDILQDAWLHAYRKLGEFRGDSSLATWLTRIVVNESLGRLRRSVRTAEVIQFGVEPPWDNPSAGEMMSQTEKGPEQAAHRAEVRRLIEQKIDELPNDFRTVFVLRALEEMSVEETAACLGIVEATVRSRYFRAKGLLRESISRELDFAIEEAFMFDGERCDRIAYTVLKLIHSNP